MATNRDVIQGALQLLGVLTEVESPSAEQAALGLEVMNDMLEDWAEHSIQIGQYPQDDLSNEFSGPPGAYTAVKSNLAVHLAPYFERQPNSVLVALAMGGYDRLLRDAVNEQLKPADMSNMPRGSADWWQPS